MISSCLQTSVADSVGDDSHFDEVGTRGVIPSAILL